MDEEELLYREMNEEDPFYMGDSPTSHRHNTQTRPKSYKRNTPYKPTTTNNNGCLTNFIGFIGVCFTMLILILIFC